MLTAVYVCAFFAFAAAEFRTITFENCGKSDVDVNMATRSIHMHVSTLLEYRNLTTIRELTDVTSQCHYTTAAKMHSGNVRLPGCSSALAEHETSGAFTAACLL